MNPPEKPMKPIWFFVGLMLIVMGGLVLAAGIMELFRPIGRTTLSLLRPNLWWGGLMIVCGIFFFVKNRQSSGGRDVRVERPD